MSDDYKLTTEWPLGRITVSEAVDIETAEEFKDFYESTGATSVTIEPPKDVFDCE